MGVRIGGKRVAGWMARGMALVLLAGLAMPSRAADERAVKLRVAPVYPEIAKRMRISGVVKLEVTVDADGRVLDVKPVSGNQMLSTAAQEAVKKWKFAPGDGQATVQIAVNFDAQ
ncbi:MAG: energy transducer TonB [Terracidiphilus sp.]|nr:energy transducer TonB [Terracidiphilus sp.]